MRTLALIAFRNLIQARRRTLLLGGALAFVSGLFVLMLALSSGIRASIFDAATTISSGHINVGGFYKAKPSDAFPMVTDVSKLRRAILASSDEIERILDRGRGWGKLISPVASVQAGMSGIDITEELAFVKRLQMAKQSEYIEGGEDKAMGKAEDLAREDGVLIFASQAERLQVDVGDVLTITSESLGGAINTTDVVVVAVARDLGMSRWSMFVHKNVLEELYRLKPDTSGAVMVYLKDPSRNDIVLGQIAEGLRASGYQLMERRAEPFWQKFSLAAGQDWVGQRLDLTTWQDEISFIDWFLLLMDYLSVLLLGILMVIIAIGVMNTMATSVRERTNEIGTLRAIGMGRAKVMLLFMLEAAILGLVSTISGGLLGGLAAMALDAAGIPLGSPALQAMLMSDTVNLVVEPVSILIAATSLSLFTMLAALFPSIMVARLQPMSAITRAS